jgi:hypothetical protein
MVTTTASPTASAAEHDGPVRRSAARSMVRGAGAFLDAAVRVFLLGGEIKH